MSGRAGRGGIGGAARGSVGFLSRAGSQFCVLAVTILATRVLGLADFGAYAIASSVVILSRTLYYVGSYEYLLKTPDYRELKGSCLAANGLFALASSLICVVFALLSPRLFGSALVEPLALWLTPSLAIAALVAWFEALLLRRQRVRTYYAATLGADIVASLATAWGFHAGFGVFALVIQTYVRLLVLAGCYVRYAGDARGWHHARFADVGAIVRWSWPRYVSAFMNYWTTYGADLLLGALLSPAASGLYRASNRIVSATNDIFTQPLLKISQTRLSAHSARGGSSGREWVLLFETVAAFAWASLAGLALFSPAIVQSLLGARWLPAVPIVMLLCVVRGITMLDAATTAYLACSNQQRFMLRVQATVSILIVSVSAAFARFGVMAVAAGVGAVLVGSTIMLARRAARLSGVSGQDLARAMRTAFLPALGVLVTYAVARPLGSPAHLASTLFVTELLLAGAGGLFGLFLVRDSLLRAARTFASDIAA